MSLKMRKGNRKGVKKGKIITHSDVVFVVHIALIRWYRSQLAFKLPSRGFARALFRCSACSTLPFPSLETPYHTHIHMIHMCKVDAKQKIGLSIYYQIKLLYSLQQAPDDTQSFVSPETRGYCVPVPQLKCISPTYTSFDSYSHLTAPISPPSKHPHTHKHTNA